MRSIAFVNHIRFHIDGNVSAMVLADCDNDSANELIAATLEGDLAVFKGNQTNCWALSQNLGMVISVIVGDILNNKKNQIISVSVEGFCHIFSIDSSSAPTHRRNPSVKTNLSSKLNTIIDSDEKCSAQPLTPFYTQRLPANAKVACLADIDNDGHNEFIVGLTDRVVRTYRCVHINDKIKLIGIHKWEFIDQIGTLSLNPAFPSTDDSNHYSSKAYNILVAQPGGTYAKLECWNKRLNVSTDDQFNSNSQTVSKLTPEYKELSIAQMRNPNISTEILGGIKGRNRSGEKTDSLIALATLDGTLMLVDGSDILWSLQVDHQLFALSKLDITNDENEEIIACSWDGLTYIVDHNRDSLRFKFEEPVSAFVAGEYGLTAPADSSKPNVKCLVYSTFNNSIYLYFDIHINRIKSSDFCEAIQSSPELVEDVKQLMSRLGLQNTDLSSVQSVCSDILFGLP